MTDLPITVSQEPLIDPRTGEERKKRFVTVIRAEKWWVEKARADPAFFQHYISGMEPPKHHRIWLANIFHPARKRVNLIAPRDSGKTTCLAYAMAYHIGRFPLTTNGIVSVASDQAEKRMRMIRSTVGDNIRYRNVFPHIEIDTRYPDTQTEFTVWSSEGGRTYNNWRRLVSVKGEPKDPTIRVTGRTGRVMIGARLSGLLLLDDIIDGKDIDDEIQDEVMQYIMETLEPAVKETGKIVNIGTRWMLGDVPERFKNNPEWRTIEIQATLYGKDGQRYSYWPEYWPLSRLDDKRRKMNNDALYFVMYENNPTALMRSRFKEQELRRDLPIPLPKFISVCISTDWALSLKTDADFTVFQAYGIDENYNVFLLDQLRLKKQPEEAVNDLIKFSKLVAETYGQLDSVLIENVAFQAVLMPLILMVDPQMPIAGVVPRGDKGHRAGFVSDWVRRGKMFIRQSIPDLEILIAEWLNFPIHRHDDTLDPASLLFQYFNMGAVAAEYTGESVPNTDGFLL